MRGRKSPFRPRKLTAAQEWAIGEMYRTGISPAHVSPAHLAGIFRVSLRTIHNVRDRAMAGRPAEVA